MMRGKKTKTYHILEITAKIASSGRKMVKRRRNKKTARRLMPAGGSTIACGELRKTLSTYAEIA